MVNVKRLGFALKVCVTALLIIFLFSRVGVAKIKDVLLGTSLHTIVIVIIFLLLVQIITTINALILTRAIKKKIGFWTIFKYILVSYSIGLLTPGKIGEFSLAFLLRKNNVKLGQGFAISVIDRFITLITLGFIAVGGFFIFFKRSTALYLMAIVLLALVFALSATVSGRVRKIIRKYILGKHEKRLKGFYLTLKFLVKKRFLLVLLNTALTFLKWVLAAYMYSLLFLHFGVSLGVDTILLVISMTTLISIMPVSLSGLGVRETSATYLFSVLGVPMNITAGIFIFTTIINYIICLAASVIFHKEIEKLF